MSIMFPNDGLRSAHLPQETNLKYRIIVCGANPYSMLHTSKAVKEYLAGHRTHWHPEEGLSTHEFFRRYGVDTDWRDLETRINVHQEYLKVVDWPPLRSRSNPDSMPEESVHQAQRWLSKYVAIDDQTPRAKLP